MSRRDHPHTAFLTSVAECFDVEAREEGARLALRGDVHSLGGDATFAEALVLDQPARRVWLGLRDRMFEASCDCPQRARGVFCKHIWALIVLGVSKGYLGGMGLGVLPAMRSSLPPQERPLVAWQEAIGTMRSEPARAFVERSDEPELLYYADPEEIGRRGLMVVRVATRRRKKNGGLGVPQLKGLMKFHVDRLTNPVDQRILELFMGADGEADTRSSIMRDSFVLGEALADVVLPFLAGSGRFVLWDGHESARMPPASSWDAGGPWTVRYTLKREEGGKVFHLVGRFERDGVSLDLAAPEVAVPPGILFLNGKGARFTARGDYRWVAFLRRRGTVRVPSGEIEPFLTELFALRGPISVELPPELNIKVTDVVPRPRLQLTPAEDYLIGKVSFDYEGLVVEPKDPRELIFKSVSRGLLRRRLDAEREALGHLTARNLPGTPESYFEIDPRELLSLVADLVP